MTRSTSIARSPNDGFTTVGPHSATAAATSAIDVADRVGGAGSPAAASFCAVRNLL